MICHPCRDAAAGKANARHCNARPGPGAWCDCAHRPVRQPAPQPTPDLEAQP